MGADLLVAYLTIDCGKQPDWKAGARKITELATTALDAWPGDYLEYRGIQQGDQSEDRQAYVNELEADLKAAELAWKHDLRDAVCCDISNKVVLISGGMSWGDDPTETYTSIWRLHLSGVAKTCGFDG